MLSFTQVNLHKATHATVLLGQALENKTQVISLVTEPHTVAGRITGMPPGACVISDKSIQPDQPGPRAGIIASRDVKLQAMDAWCHRDCAVAIAPLHGRRTLLASVYLDIREPAVPTWLTRLLDMAEQKNLPILLGMDSNAHSSLYGPDNNRRGDEIEDFILQHGLEVHNSGETPTFEVKRGNTFVRTHIDVTLSRELHFRLEEWRVDQSYNASDHNTIRFETMENPTSAVTVRPWASADWGVFTDSLKTASYFTPEHISMKKLDKMTAGLYTNLEAALNKCCPVITVKDSVKQYHWATDVHDTAKKEVSKLYKTAKQTGKDEDWQAYKAADGSFKKMCRRDRNKAWRKYKESLQTEKEMAALTKLAQRQERREVNVLTRQDGSSTDPGAETISLLTRTHFPAATDQQRVTYNNRRNCLVDQVRDKYKDWITPQLIVTALGGFEKKKSPGPDGIKPLIFEHLPPEFISALELVYKSCIHLGYTPKLWKKTKVIFISKPGKESYDKPKSFRPISLSNYFLKGLERLVGWKMDQALVHFPIHHKQHGFLTGRSTESAISNTTDYIEKHIMRRQHCVGVFLDISSAFDSIKASHVRRALLDHGGDPEMVQWYYNYITHRDILIDLHGEHVAFSTGVGFPQGGVCSAKFWLIAFDFAIKIINTYNIEGNGYADDCSALYGGPRLDHAISRLQKMLDSLTAWGKRCGLHFNPEKSVAVVFTRRRKTPPRPLYIDGKAIPYEKEVKYLGVTLDSKLHWKTHITEKISKAKRFVQHVAAITRNNWGPKPKLMRWAYLGIVRPMLSYGSMIWGHRAPHHKDKLQRLNRMAINTFGRFPKSTPTAALEVMLDIAPLHLFCQQEGLAARTRLSGVVDIDWTGTTTNKTHNVSHLRHWAQALGDLNIDPSDNDRCSITKWSTGFRLNRDSFTGEAKHRHRTQYNIYTDGSRQDDQTGGGFVVYRQREVLWEDAFRLPDHATVFQAEVTAIKQAAIKLAGANPPDLRYVKFFVDSQAALLALGSPMIRSRAVSEAVDALNRLSDLSYRVTLCWIPAHKGHAGNERADTLAKRGTKLTGDSSLVSSKRPHAAIKAEIRQGTYGAWQREWLSNAAAQHTKYFYYCASPVKAKFVYKLARLELSRFVRLISGHNNLNYFQHRIGLGPTARCRFCNANDEKFTHLIEDCPRFWATRREMFLDRPPCNDMKWSVRTLLEFSYLPGINEAFEGTWAHNDPPDDQWDSHDDDTESSLSDLSEG